MMSQYAHLSTLDPEFAAALAKAPAPPVPTSINGARESSAAARKLRPKVSFPETQLKVEDHKVPIHHGEIAIRIYIPQPIEGRTYPLLVWAHGGGFAEGGLDSDDGTLQNLAVDLKLSIVSVDYRLAPEHPFPDGLNDTYEALKWASTHARDLHADLTKGFLIGGVSAGANFTAVLTHRARDDPILRGQITGQILQIPFVVHQSAIPEQFKAELLSLEQNKDAPILSMAHMAFFIDTYQATNPTDPEVSPLLFPSHKDLPPAYFQICGLDPLRDEGFLYEKILKQEGVKTKVNVYPGLPHGFREYYSFLQKSATWDQELKAGIIWLLAGHTQYSDSTS